MSDKKASFNGALAYRDGADLTDNPFSKERDQIDWFRWREQFLDEQDRKVGKI